MKALNRFQTAVDNKSCILFYIWRNHKKHLLCWAFTFFSLLFIWLKQLISSRGWKICDDWTWYGFSQSSAPKEWPRCQLSCRWITHVRCSINGQNHYKPSSSLCILYVSNTHSSLCIKWYMVPTPAPVTTVVKMASCCRWLVETLISASSPRDAHIDTVKAVAERRTMDKISPLSKPQTDRETSSLLYPMHLLKTSNQI